MPNRTAIIAISVIACGFGVLSLYGPEDQRGLYYGVNVAVSIAASIFASIDLRRRGYAWGWAMLAAYLLPLVGTILYVVFSSLRGYDAPAPAPASAPQSVSE